MTPNQIHSRGVVPKIKQLLSNFITQIYQGSLYKNVYYCFNLSLYDLYYCEHKILHENEHFELYKNFRRTKFFVGQNLSSDKSDENFRR